MRNWKNPIATYVPSTITDEPAARPSRPSVKFTALDQAATSSQARMTNPTAPTDRKAMSRV